MFTANSFLSRGNNLSDILNPTIARANLGIGSGILTPGTGLTGAAYNASNNTTFSVNVSQDGATASTANTFVVQYDVNGNVTANTATCSNLTLGSFITSPIIKVGGTGTIQGYAGGAGNLLISSTSSGVIGLNSPNGSISQSAINGFEVYATGYKNITTNTGTAIRLYTGSTAPYSLQVNSGLNSNGKFTCTGGANIDVLTATTSFLTPLANITSLVSAASTITALTATNATISSVLNAINYITTPTLYTSNAVVIQPPTAFRGTPSALALNDQSISALVKMGLSAPSITINSTTGCTANLTQYSTATSALNVVGGLLCSLASGYGAASNALTVTGGAVIDSINSVFRQPALPNFCVSIPSPQIYTTGVMTANISPPVGFTFASSFGYINFLTTGRYKISVDCNGFTGSSQASFSVQLVAYSGGTPLAPTYPVGQFITASGSYTALFDATAGQTININTTASSGTPCVFTRFAMTCHFIC